ncbi:unnamed protein product [Rotaria sp. Silwood2]|nr:unnamed protein product [Rotaria sp. Silwood2]
MDFFKNKSQNFWNITSLTMCCPVTTQKGSRAIYFRQNFYRLQKRNKNDPERWMCTNRHCSSSLITKNKTIQSVRGTHNHGNVKRSLSIIKTVDKIRQEVCDSPSKPITQIYNDAVSTYRQINGTAEIVPIFDVLRSTLYRDRATVLPKLPIDLNDLLLPDKFTKNLYNETMLFCDQKQPSCVLAFASLTALKQLDLSDEIKKQAVKREIANILSLPLLPPNKIEAAFHDSVDVLQAINPNFGPLLNYIEKTYIVNAKFKISNWNHYHTLCNLPRTNNHIEGYHRYLNRRRNNSLLQSSHFPFHQNLKVSYFETLKKSIVTYNTELLHLPILYLDKNDMKFKIKNAKTLITFEHYSKTLDSINYHLKCYFILNKSIVFTSKTNETDSLASENNYVDLSAPEIKQFTQFVQKIITANKNHKGFIRSCVRGNYNNDLLFFNTGGNY